MNRKMTIALVYGGPSAEYDVSLKSAETIRNTIDKQKYLIVDVHITRNGAWEVDGKKLTESSAIRELEAVDVAFLAVHGTFGEDGKLQQLLANHGVVFTGSDSAASALAMNKVDAAEVFKKAGLSTPTTFTAGSAKEAIEASQSLELPFVVKPVSQGSSFGVSIVRQAKQRDAAIELAFQYDSQIIAQEFISGREVSCGVLEDSTGQIKALPPTELIPVKADFFDYDAKYTPGATNEITPPDMSEDVIKQIQEVAVTAHQKIGCKNYSRTDTIVTPRDVVVIEINTLPGMTATSCLPQQAIAAGMSLSELIDSIINTAMMEYNNSI